MGNLAGRYEKKIINQELAVPGDVVLAELDAEIIWNQDNPAIKILLPIFDGLNINSLLFSLPAEPYRTIIGQLSENAKDKVTPKDNETRTFLHDIPVIKSFSSKEIIEKLKNRKCVIIKDHGITTYGTVSPEQAYVNYSSALFSCFVKYFADFLKNAKLKKLNASQINAFNKVLSFLKPLPEICFKLIKGPFSSEKSICEAISQAGKMVVNYGLVDSVMGNISYRHNDMLYISQTGSFLDELESCIDPCPMDNSSCIGITASSELPTHLAITRNTSLCATLHGHPKFAVILSMICEKEEECKFNNSCHIKCPEKRFINGIPVVIGESGTGPRSILKTVPQAIKDHKSAIVYGHGVFTAGDKDFNDPFLQLYLIEKMCREKYFNELKKAGIMINLP